MLLHRLPFKRVCASNASNRTAILSTRGHLARPSTPIMHPRLLSTYQPINHAHPFISPSCPATKLNHINHCPQRLHVSSRSFASITTTQTSASRFDHELHHFLESLQTLLESGRFESCNLDVNLADGVLSVASPTKGTWILNKHTPTRQIWLSSPLSGPRKYNFHSDAPTLSPTISGEGWLGERDLNDALKTRLIQEWTAAFGVKIDRVQDFQVEGHEE